MHNIPSKRPLRLRPVALLALFLFAFTARGSNAAISADEKAILSNISASDMMSTVDKLCSDRFAGRRAGSNESSLAAEYLSSEFAHRGLTPVGSSGFEEPILMRYSLVRSNDEIRTVLNYKSGNKTKTRTFSYSGYNGNGGLNLHSKVVFVGYGIHDPENGHDDYKGIDVSGKIVLWIPGQPKGLRSSKSSTGAQKMLSAYLHGAVACLISRSAGSGDDWGTNVGLSGSIADFPYIAVDPKIACELMAPSLTTKKPSLAALKPGTSGIGLTLRVSPVCDPKRRAYNLVGMIKGTDPGLSDQVVMVGAHYDHLGSLPRVGVFRGADDNASGTSVVLEVARAISRSGIKPKRSIIFASWTAEEAGLVGSNAFAQHPPFPLKEIVSNIELDMVGCGTPKSFMTTGATAFPEHYRHLSDSAEDLGYTLKADTIAGASDHLSFSRRRSPVSLLYSAGVHPHYHTTSDMPSDLNKDVLLSAARLTALSIWRAAQS